jgi:uncharacterized protein YciI
VKGAAQKEMGKTFSLHTGGKEPGIDIEVNDESLEDVRKITADDEYHTTGSSGYELLT